LNYQIEFLMKVLIACEFSGIVREAFKAKGHDAWSCDLLPTEIEGQHYQGYLEDFIGGGNEWDMIIAHPPCTYLSYAATKYWNQPGRTEKREYAAAAFFMMIANRDCPKIVIENPVGYMNNVYRKPDQIIHPWQFGQSANKRTCLWLKGVLPLTATDIVAKPSPTYIDKASSKKRYFTDAISGDAKGQKERSKTFQGIAAAMADQWG
jgi:site-specific DNA-cytosine methylase